MDRRAARHERLERPSDKAEASAGTPSAPRGARPHMDLAVLQRSIGNEAVLRLLRSGLEVTDAGHSFEHQADLAERTVSSGSPDRPVSHQPGTVARRTSTLASGTGTALPAKLRRRLEPSLGPLDGVRVHRDAHADGMTSALGAEAMTHGSDIFMSRAFDRAGTDAGDRLLAHEAAHATGAAAASGMVHLKRVKKHLDFIRIKKKSTQITRMLTSMALNKIGAKSAAERVMTDSDGDEIDAYGHWWIETGQLTTPGDMASWKPVNSYGWWPEDSVSIAQTLKIDRVEGKLNQDGGDHDPHEDDKAETQYHPVLEVDDTESYDSVVKRVGDDLSDFAHSFKGSWNWRLAWGKNCHTFLDRAKKKLKLHHQKSKQWLTGTGLQAVVAPLRGYAEVANDWDEFLTGQGYGGLNYLRLLPAKVSEAELMGLSAIERQNLFAKLNEGQAGFNLAKEDELNRELRNTYGSVSFDTWLV